MIRGHLSFIFYPDAKNIGKFIKRNVVWKVVIW